MAKDVETKEQIASTAAISAGGDAEVGELIAEAMDKVGKEGVITVEESQTFGLELELTEGMRFDKGYISPYFVTDTERMETVLEDPYMLIANSKISAVKDRLPFWRRSCKVGKPLHDHRRRRRRRSPRHPRCEQDPRHLQDRVASRHQASAIAVRQCCRTLRSSPVARSSAKKSASSSTPRHWISLVAPARSSSPRTRPPSLRVPGTRTRFRVASTRSGRDRKSDSDYDREKLQERLAKLAGGVAVIKVGAATKLNSRSASTASRTPFATQGCCRRRHRARRRRCLIQAMKAAGLKIDALGLTTSKQWARTLFAFAVSAPLKQIAENAGLEGGVVVEKVRELPAGRASTLQRRVRRHDRAGIIDPAKVTRSALQNAASIAGLFLTTEVVVADKPEKAAPAMPGGGDMGGMDF